MCSQIRLWADRLANYFLKILLYRSKGSTGVKVPWSESFWNFRAKVFGTFAPWNFVLMIRQFHRNESSWNVRSRGTKVPRERMFHRTKVLGTFAPEERKFHGSESSLYGLFAPGNESAEERKGLESCTQLLTASVVAFIVKVLERF